MDEPLEFEELWGLEIDDEPGQLVYPIDSNNHYDRGALLYFSREAAESAAEHQLDLYGLECRPRRIVTE